MGNQQLLPLMLATIIVSLALTIGVQAYRESFRAQQEEEMHRTLVDAAQRAQGWYRKSRALGGGNRSFAQISWRKINVKSDGFAAKYTVSEKERDRVRLTAVSKLNPSLIISYMVYADSLVLMNFSYQAR